MPIAVIAEQHARSTVSDVVAMGRCALNAT
jgi:hypothetical protein